MNKPLTIDELKALKVGDWVWIVDNDIKGYAQVEVSKAIGDKGFIMPNKRSYGFGYYDTYGTEWLAYKNKEQAECKGEIVELKSYICTGKKGYYIHRQIIAEDTFFVSGDKTEAERRLAELRGENYD